MSNLLEESLSAQPSVDFNGSGGESIQPQTEAVSKLIVNPRDILRKFQENFHSGNKSINSRREEALKKYCVDNQTPISSFDAQDGFTLEERKLMIDHICHELGLFDLISKESTIAVPRNSRNSFNQDLDAEVQPLASIFPSSSAASAAESSS
jgi:hypothetical protein